MPCRVFVVVIAGQSTYEVGFLLPPFSPVSIETFIPAIAATRHLPIPGIAFTMYLSGMVYNMQQQYYT